MTTSASCQRRRPGVFAGPAAEIARLRETSWQRDEEHALRRAVRIVLLLRGLREHEEDDDVRATAAALVEKLRPIAAALIEANYPR